MAVSLCSSSDCSHLDWFKPKAVREQYKQLQQETYWNSQQCTPALTHSHAYNKSLTFLPSSSPLVGWDHDYWLADGPGGQWCRLYLWLCVGTGVCIPCHVLCPGMLPGPGWVSDEHTVAGPMMTEWDPGTQASPKVWRLHRRRSRGTDGFRGMERPQPGCGVYLHFRRRKWTHGYIKRLCLRLITEWVEDGRNILETYKH